MASAAHTPSMAPTVLQHVVCESSPSSVVERPSLAASAFSESESMTSSETDDSVAADDDDADAAADDDDDADDDAAAADADDDDADGEEIAAGISPFGGGSGVLIAFDFVKPNCFLGLHAVYTLTP